MYVTWRVYVTRLALRQLVLVVREGQVNAAAVDVHRAAQHVAAHDAALDVPPRAQGSPALLRFHSTKSELRQRSWTAPGRPELPD